MKNEALLSQLNGLESYLDAGQTTKAREAISGLRHLILSTNDDNADHAKNFQRLEAQDIRKLVDDIRQTMVNQGSIDGSPSHTVFRDDIICWGWYDSQIDKAGRRYRWCGQSQEVGLRIPFNFDESAALVLGVRAFDPSSFTRNAIEIQINGTPVPTTFLPNSRSEIFDLLLHSVGSRQDNIMEITFYISNEHMSRKKSENKRDQRNLVLNVFDITWVPR